MDSKILSSLGKIAGLGGIAFGVLLLLYRGVLEKQFLPQAGLGSGQAFAIILCLLILTFGIAGIGVIAWLIGRTTGPRAPVPNTVLGVLATLMVAVLGATLLVGARVNPEPITEVPNSNLPNSQSVPAPPTQPSRPVDGDWDLTMECPDKSRMSEMNARFSQGRYARAFTTPDSQKGITELAMGYLTDDTILVTGYVLFGTSNVYQVNAVGKKKGNYIFR